MHSLQEILKETRKDLELCCAIEKGGIFCYSPKYKTSKYCTKHQSRISRLKSFDLPIKLVKKCKMILCEGKVVAKNYCNKHYRKRKLIIETKRCSVPDCSRVMYVKELCNMHYRRRRRYGDLNANFSHMRYRNFNENIIPHNKGKNIGNKCLAWNCTIRNGFPHRFTKGLCKKHFSRWKKYGDFTIASKKEYLEKNKNN